MGIIKCKDCRYWDPDWQVCNLPATFGISRGPDDYCSSGAVKIFRLYLYSEDVKGLLDAIGIAYHEEFDEGKMKMWEHLKELVENCEEDV